MYKFDAVKTTDMAKALFKEERAINHLEGWFLMKENEADTESKYEGFSPM